MAAGWERVLKRAQERAPEEVGTVGHIGEMNMQRYFSYLALEAGELPTAWRLLGQGLGKAPRRFFGERRNYLLAGGLVAKAVLPEPWYWRLERRVRRS